MALAILLLLLLIAGIARGRELRYDDALFTIVIPDGWDGITTPAYQSQRVDRMLQVLNADTSMVFEVYVTYDRKLEFDLDDEFIGTAFEDLRSRGVEPRDSGYTTLGGIRALQFGLTAIDSGTKIDRYVVETIANGAIYEMVASSTVRRPEFDADVRRMIESFAFIGTPEIPDPDRPHPRYRERPSQQKVEWMAFGGLFTMIAVTFIGFRVWRVWSRRRQRQREERAWKE